MEGERRFKKVMERDGSRARDGSHALADGVLAAVVLVEDVAGPSRQLGRHPQSWLLPAYAAYFRLL